MEKLESYIEFLKYCLDTSRPIPASVATINWHDLLEFAQKQSIVGIFWQGINSPSALNNFYGNKPTDDDVMEWMGEAHLLQMQSKLVDEKAAWVAGNFKQEGFKSCLLKGQGIALLYPNPALRTSGDIDIWVAPMKASGSQEEDVEAVLSYCRKFVPDTKACYHHIDFRNAGEISVEVHYRPSWASCPWHNQRLQKYFFGCFSSVHPSSDEKSILLDSGKGFFYPDFEFNVIFLLHHIYRHALYEGIGLRQIIDYYYLLFSNKGVNKAKLAKQLAYFGMQKIASGISWILVEILGLKEDYMIVAPNAKYGRIIWDDIIEGGNFCKYSSDQPSASGTYLHNLKRIKKDLKMLSYFPAECLWEPWFRIWHWAWRKRH